MPRLGVAMAEHLHETAPEKPEATMPSEETVARVAELFKVFGDVSRIRIMYLLRNGETSVGDLAEALEMTQSAVSHQLRTLRQARLVKNRRDGKTIYYALDDEHVQRLIELATEHIVEA